MGVSFYASVRALVGAGPHCLFPSSECREAGGWAAEHFLDLIGQISGQSQSGRRIDRAGDGHHPPRHPELRTGMPHVAQDVISVPTSLTLLDRPDSLAACCAPVVREVMTPLQAATLATALKALADLARRWRSLRLRPHRPCRTVPTDRVPPPQDPGRSRDPHPSTTRQMGLLPPRTRHPGRHRHAPKGIICRVVTRLAGRLTSSAGDDDG